MSSIKSWILLLGLLASGAVYAAEPININEADAETLAMAIKGVGVKRAEAIIAYRKQNGPFTSVDELVNVQGIGTKMLEDSRSKLTVDPAGG